jgi:hypothetical protein
MIWTLYSRLDRDGTMTTGCVRFSFFSPSFPRLFFSSPQLETPSRFLTTYSPLLSHSCRPFSPSQWFRGPATRAAVPEDGAISLLPAGGSLTLEFGCSPYYSTWPYGGDPAGTVACDDPGPLHANPSGGEVEEEWIAGCALGIADVMEPGDATPDNFVRLSLSFRIFSTILTDFPSPRSSSRYSKTVSAFEMRRSTFLRRCRLAVENGASADGCAFLFTVPTLSSFFFFLLLSSLYRTATDVLNGL